MLAPCGAEGAHQPDIADDVGEIAADMRGVTGEALVQMGAVSCHPADGRAQHPDDDQQYRRQMPVDRAEHENAAEHGRARRDGGPCERVLDGPRSIGRRGDAARQCAGKALDEVARTLAGQVIEEIQANISPHCHKSIGRHPAGKPP